MWLEITLHNQHYEAFDYTESQHKKKGDNRRLTDVDTKLLGLTQAHDQIAACFVGNGKRSL